MGANVPQGMGVPKCIGVRGPTLHVDSCCRGPPKEPSRLEEPARPCSLCVRPKAQRTLMKLRLIWTPPTRSDRKRNAANGHPGDRVSQVPRRESRWLKYRGDDQGQVTSVRAGTSCNRESPRDPQMAR